MPLSKRRFWAQSIGGLLRCPECGGGVTEVIDEDTWEALYACLNKDCWWYKVVDLNEGIKEE